MTIGLTMAEDATAQSNSSSSWWPFSHSTPPAPATPADDPISLKTPAKVGVELYISVANLYIESGKYTEAEDQYQQAMKLAPDDIRVLLGYAMLKDAMNQPQEAIKFYQHAKQKHPKDPSVYNNLAIHYVRQGMVREAIEAGRQAVDLHPREPRYRNNLAAILVEDQRPQEAFQQLRAVYDEATAHYDLGFLLNKRGMKAAALQEFVIAQRINPAMTMAGQWVERLSQERRASNPDMARMAPLLGPIPHVIAADRDTLPPPPAAPLQPAPLAPTYAAPPIQPQLQYPAENRVQLQIPSPPSYPVQAPSQQTNLTPGQAVASGAVVPPQTSAWQNAGPQNPPWQYQYVPSNQNPPPPPGPTAAPAPIMAFRDFPASGVRPIAPPPEDDKTMRRLPPIGDPWNANDPNRDPAGPEVVAPNPPEWRR
jgi:Tfp pilus assembly protein PilF